MSLSIELWHQRYKQQARWTQHLRRYVYDKAGVQYTNKILDVGCGTGVLLDELSHLATCKIYGLDIDPNSLRMVQETVTGALNTQGDAHRLPYRAKSFDISLCHFLLLWVKSPLHVLKEMVRVTRPGGYILALAEPDYGSRIDYPEALSQVGQWQTGSLVEQGANPLIGRELRSLFSQVDLRSIEVGVLGGQWGEDTNIEEFELEWQVIKSDLSGKLEFTRSKDELKALDLSARQSHQRILYVPTFYAFGMVDG